MSLEPVASPAAPFARRSPRARLQLIRRVQAGAVASCTLLAAVGWTQLVRLDWNPALILVPILVAATGMTPFIRRGRAVAAGAIVLRAALWASFVFGTAAALSTNTRLDAGALVAVPAGIALLCLRRFSRALHGERPLLTALTAIALGDAVSHGLVASFILVDQLQSEYGSDLDIVAVFGFICVANVAGLVCIRRAHLVWPHVAGNVVVIALAALDVAGTKPMVNVVVGGAAALQIVLALLLRAPPASRATRRVLERALRVVIAVVVVVDAVVAVHARM